MANRSLLTSLVLILFGTLLSSNISHALELSWNGQFRTEYHLIHNYEMDSSDSAAYVDATRAAAGGYYIPGSGQNNANLQTLFLKLQPSVEVNDNVKIKSEWWVGDPVFGFFGNASPYSFDQKQFYSTQSRGSVITAQRFWAEVLTDVGTIHVGRAPLHWGLGVVWNSGDSLWDRYASTGDVIRLVAHFGAFTFIPSYISYSSGNSMGGAVNCAAGVCTPGTSTGNLTDYSLILKYVNENDAYELGVNFIKRMGGDNQEALYGYHTLNGVYSGMHTINWDVYGKKQFGQKFTLTGEMPLVSGNLGGIDYSSIAFAGELGWKISDSWDLALKAGTAPGQPNLANGSAPDRYRIFFFNPNYKVGLIMFNYQLNNLGGLHTLNNLTASESQLQSPYDNPITNAQYYSFSGNYKTDKWTFRGNFIFAMANQAAAQGSQFFNTWTRQYVNNAFSDQSTSLGWELDLGTSLQWDDLFQFALDTGVFVPGAFYKFSNSATENAASPVFAVVTKIGISF